MKKKMILAIFILFVFAIGRDWYVNRISTSFATSVSLKYYGGEDNLDITIVDQEDIMELKRILNGFTWEDSPSCGFTEGISIKFSDDQKDLVLCPAIDGDPYIRVGSSNRYLGISEEEREVLDEILAKYGMVFPCF